MGSAHCAHCAHCAHGKMKLTRLHACENQTDRPTARCFILNANFQRREASLFMASDFEASFHLNWKEKINQAQILLKLIKAHNMSSPFENLWKNNIFHQRQMQPEEKSCTRQKKKSKIDISFIDLSHFLNYLILLWYWSSEVDLIKALQTSVFCQSSYLPSLQ